VFEGGCTFATWFDVTSLVDILSLAMGIETNALPEKIKTDVRDVLFQKWHFWIWIPDIGSNAIGIVITIRQARFLRLGTHRFRVLLHVIVVEHQLVKSTATVVQKF
jgi:hypothetical protein